MPINTNVTNEQITVSVGETQIDVSVNGGVGPTGNAGAAATITVGTVTTGAPGSSASVVNAGSSSAAVLNFSIPAGATGATGPQGPQGPAGTTTWAGITDKPSTFPPSSHTHDDRYYTEAEIDALLSGKQAAGSYAASSHTHVAANITDFTSAVIAAAPPTTNASLLTSGTLPDARLSGNIARASDPRLNVTWPVRAVHVGGLFKITNGLGSFLWLPATWPTGDFGDLATLATVEHATQSVTVNLTATRDAILAANPGWSLVRSSLEVALIDCDNRIVGWGTTELNGEYGPTHGNGGHVITVSVGDFPSIPAQYKTAWVLSDDAGTFSSNASYVINRPTPYKFVAHRALDIGRYDWNNITNRPAVATLVNGTVPAAQLPSYVDDVIEAASLAALPVTGDAGKIYVARDTGRIYRWSGSAYVEISPSPGSTDAVPEGATNLYHTTARAAAAAPVQSVAGRTGAVTIAAADVSGLGSLATQSSVSYASLTGTPSTFAPSAHKSSHATGGSDALSPADIGASALGHAHSALTDITGLAPIATSGSASDLSAGTVPIARLPVGQTAASVAAGDDARFTDARTPTGAAGGDLTGTYPNPQIAPGAVVTADIADAAVTDAKIAAVSAAKLTGTIADARLSANVVLTGDARLSDARTPLAHTHDAAAITTGTVAAARLPLATRAQAIDGSASSAVVSPATALDQLMASGHLDLSTANVSTAGQNLWQTAFSGAVSISVGSGSGGGSVYVAHYLSGSPYLTKWNGLTGGSSIGNFSGRYIDWTKRQLFVMRMGATSAVSANAVLRVTVGKGQLGTANIGALDRRGIGFEIRAGGALWLVAHNGTTRTDTNTGFTFTAAYNVYEIAIESTGTGTANLYLDSVVRATNSGAPTTPTPEQPVMLTMEATTTDLSSSGFGLDRYFRYLRP